MWHGSWGWNQRVGQAEFSSRDSQGKFTSKFILFLMGPGYELRALHLQYSTPWAYLQLILLCYLGDGGLTNYLPGWFGNAILLISASQRSQLGLQAWTNNARPQVHYSSHRVGLWSLFPYGLLAEVGLSSRRCPFLAKGTPIFKASAMC
jgi:hypothetical protein